VSDNIIDRTTAGEGGFTNEPAFPNDNATSPADQGGSHVWAGQPIPAPPSGNAVEQNFVTPGSADDRIGTEVPEQAYAKPTASPTPNALGPGMVSRG
jgi:hypothetical protein